MSMQELLQTCILILRFFYLGVSLEEDIVFPRLLEERSEEGKQLVLVNNDLHLELQKASILAERFFISGFSEKNVTPRMVSCITKVHFFGACCSQTIVFGNRSKIEIRTAVYR